MTIKPKNTGGMSLFAPDNDDKYIWVTEFNDHTLEDFYSKFMELEADPMLSFIPVIVSSYGGEVDVIVAMRDIMKSSSKPVATIALGKAMSAGASLLAAGTKGYRFAAPSTTIMIHEMISYNGGKASDVSNSADLIRRLQDDFFKSLAEDAGMSVVKLRTLLKKNNNADLFLTAQKAVDLGIIDHIGVPRLQTIPAHTVMAVPLHSKAAAAKLNSMNSKDINKSRKRKRRS